jgi:hypothetical protein
MDGTSGERHLSRRRAVECGGSIVDRGGGQRGDGVERALDSGNADSRLAVKITELSA